MIHFSTLQSLGKVEPKCLKEYADLLSTLIQEFDIRFTEFKALQPQFQLFSTPFAVQIDDVTEELQMELAELQSDTILKQKHADVGIPKFYSFFLEKGFRDYSLLLQELLQCLEAHMYVNNFSRP